MLKRREFVALSAGAAMGGPRLLAAADRGPVITRSIPSSGEQVPVMGMGSSRTFDVSTSQANIEKLVPVMEAFFAGKGTIIDSSPMYGAAEEVLGMVLEKTPGARPFAATKVWTDGREQGIEQMQRSSELMGVPVFDLMQIHNLRDWKIHLATLRDWKEKGKIRYIGITTSHKRNHDELLEIMRTEPLDFVQFSYNIENRLAEERLLPIAADRGIATMINRPYQRGALFKRVKGVELPPLAVDLGCQSWGQFFLKFIIAHPAVTCLIPATSKLHHMEDNMGANFGPVPSEKQRQQMLDIYASL